MTVAARVFAFSILPVLLAALFVRSSPRVTERAQKIEVYLIFLFFGVGAGGLGGFFGHVFTPDVVAESIGWAKDSPFQQEMGFANLALGILGLVAVGRRDGFREATVLAVTVVAVGASAVHVFDIIQESNFAPGNTVQIAGNLFKPAFLIPLLRMSRKTEASGAMGSVTGLAGMCTGVVGTGFGIGFALDMAVPMMLAAALAAGVITASTARRGSI